MRQSWKELWELNKLSVKWVAKHWKGYTLALIICYGIGYILGTGGFKNCKTYIENKLKKINKRGGVLARALSFCAIFARTIMREELAQMVEHWIVISRGQGFESLTILFYFFFSG